MIIGIVNGKGGVGKTTSSIYLGKVFADLGHNVVVIDLDSQGSASDWADRAEATGDALPFPIEVSNFKRLRRTIDAAGENATVILDTPPGDPAAIDAAIEASDFVIIPTQASAIEVARVWQTLPSMDHVPHGVLITSARLGTNNLDAVVETLEDEDIAVFNAKIPIRETIRDTFGSTPTRHEGYKSVATEIMEALQ